MTKSTSVESKGNGRVSKVIQKPIDKKRKSNREQLRKPGEQNLGNDNQILERLKKLEEQNRSDKNLILEQLKKLEEQNLSDKNLILEQLKKLQEYALSYNDQIWEQLKKLEQQNHSILELQREAHNPPVVVPGTNFQASCRCRSSLHQAESSGLKRLRLSFVCKLQTEQFTMDKISAIDDPTDTTVPVRVVLLDARDNTVVNEGKLSSLKIEVFVAYGNFKAEEGKGWSWTAEDLEKIRVPTREGKLPPLIGRCIGTMEKGVCTFNDIRFGDNSHSASTCGTFKLVAKVAEGEQLPEMIEIRPAETEAFQVKELRGKPNKKRPIPSPTDEVWRLKGIGKNGPYHRILETEGIRTVMDFRRKYNTNKASLRQILGAKDEQWKHMVEHAKRCIPINNEGFQYDSEGVKLLFNCFYELVRVSLDHQNAVLYETLDESSHVEQLRRNALVDPTKLIQINTLSGWPSATTCPFVVQGPPAAQVLVEPPPPNQGELVQNELHVNLPDFPQTPLFPDEDLLQQEEPAAQSNAGGIEDFCPIANYTYPLNSDFDPLITDDYYQNLPGYPQTPIFPEEEMLQQEETLAPSSAAGIEDLWPIPSGPFLSDTELIMEYF